MHKHPRIELHGTLNELICPTCFSVFDVSASKYIDQESPRCSQGTILKPRVVLFGESVPKQKIIDSKKAIDSAQILLIIGTASDVSPAADLIRYAKSLGQSKVTTPGGSERIILVEINEQPTRITDLVDHFIQMSASDALNQLILK